MYEDWLGKQIPGLLPLLADPGGGRCVIASFLMNPNGRYCLLLLFLEGDRED